MRCHSCTVVIISLLYFVDLLLHYKIQRTYDLDCIIQKQLFGTKYGPVWPYLGPLMAKSHG